MRLGVSDRPLNMKLMLHLWLYGRTICLILVLRFWSILTITLTKSASKSAKLMRCALDLQEFAVTFKHFALVAITQQLIVCHSSKSQAISYPLIDIYDKVKCRCSFQDIAPATS